MKATSKSPATDQVGKSDLRHLESVLHALEEQIERQNSYKYSLIRGVFYGLGTVVGATVLIALFGTFLATFINQLSQIPLVNDLINQQALEQYLKDHQ